MKDQERRPAVTDEEREALRTLSKRGRLIVVLVPEGAPDGFVARLTSWSNFILDTRMLPPLPLPISRQGDGLVCPYCGVPASHNVKLHTPTCEWGTAILRWGAAQLQIDEHFGKEPS